MRILKQRKRDRVSRRAALEGVPVLNPSVRLEELPNGGTRVTMEVKRGQGFFERMRPAVSTRRYELDEFGGFVIGLVDGKRSVLDVVNAFEERFPMSRREVELSVVAFFKSLMQRNVLSVVVARPGGSVPGVGLVVAGLLLGGMLGQPLRADETAASNTLADIRAICETGGSRAPGAPGNLALEEHVARRFKESGFETGEIRFRAPAFEPGSLTLDCGDHGRFDLETMHPALMRPGNFKQDDFDTRLVFLGKGDFAALEQARGAALDGAIAVMDYDCGDKWMGLLRFGIEGFIFVGDGTCSREHSVAKVYNTEVSVPRFFIDGAAGKRLRSICAELRELPAKAHGEPSRWRNEELRDLWVLVPGAHEEHAKQVVVFTAALDANSVVPGRSYGAQRAVNLHLLLKLLDDFRAQRPLYSVILVAVNAHTQRFAGERELTWHLLAKETVVEKLRDEIAADMRLARLYSREYGRLHLDPVAVPDRPGLHVLMEVLQELDSVQQEERVRAHEEACEKRKAAIETARKNGGDVAALEEEPLPVLDEVLDLSEFNEQDVREAIGRAEKEMLDSSGGLLGGSSDHAEVEAEKKDLALLADLRSLSLEQFMARAGRIKSVFDDEKLLEKWRGSMDKTTGQRVYVKSKLQDTIKSRKNRTQQDIMIVSSTDKTTLPDAERERLRAELSRKHDDLLSILVIFNKIDIGIGRSRKYYRQIAVNDEQRELMRSIVDELAETFGRQRQCLDAAMMRDSEGDAIRDALGARKVELVIALELDAHADRVGFSYHAFGVKPVWFAGFGEICAGLAAGIAPVGGADPHPYVDALSGVAPRDPSRYFNLDNSALYYYQRAQRTRAFALKSAFCDQGELFTPHDTVTRLDPGRVHRLQDWVRRFLGAVLADGEVLSPDSLKVRKHKLVSRGTLLRTYYLEQFAGKPIPTTPVPGCLVALYDRYTRYRDLPTIIDGDVANCYMGITDEAATVCYHALGRSWVMVPLAYLMDPDFREVLFTIDKGRVQSSKQINSNVTAARATLPMFECREFVINDWVDPTLVSSKSVAQSRTYWPKVAKGQSDPEKYGIHGAACLSPAQTHRATGPVGIYLYRRRPELEQDSLMVITSKKRCVLNATDENPQGEGFTDPADMDADFFRIAAGDMEVLNRSRKADMKGVVNQLLDEFLERGAKLNEEAEASRAANDHVAYVRKNYEALGTQVKAYTEIQKMNADMLKAVVAYMALMLPFCFFLQKLLFDSKRLERELAGFSLLFTGMFVLFRVIHPAFRMAMCPEAIFIAFVLGAIGLFTTGVLRSRFNDEMTLLFRGVGGIGEEVGYGTLGQTAMLIGVQNMRRRRVRTSLTTATIVLVVFTMLAFTSVSRKARPTLIRKTDSSSYTGLFYHWPGGNLMDEESCRVIRDIFADRAKVRVRRLLTLGDRSPPKYPNELAKKPYEPWLLERASDPGASLDVRFVTGLPPDDRVLRDSMALVEGSPFSSPFAEEIMLTLSGAELLGIRAEDVGEATVRMLGREWLVRGLVDDHRYRVARDLNPNLPLVPFLKAPKPQSGDDEGELDLEVPDVTDKLIDTKELVFIPEGRAAEMGARPRSVSVDFTGQPGELELGRELRRVLNVTQAKVYLGSTTPFKLDEDAVSPVAPGAYYVGSGYRTAIGGLAKLIIPLIIAGSIVLNTMLGTVYERRSEISVFNAIGLNPTHIFLFFLAEAIVYSFIGAVGGYLIGQILTITLQNAGMIADVNINFSSLMVVYVVVLTMALVVLSTIYPGYVATRTAVPSGKRKWGMPENDGQHMSVVFPFIYRSRLALGVMSYIQKFLEPLSDQSMGDMVATLESVTRDSDDDGRAVLSLRYNLALSPYDLGVTQYVTFITRYDAIVQSFRLHMEIDRISGRDTNWVTTNRAFLERMRKFLIRWRNIDPTRQEWFVKKAEELFGGRKPEASGQADRDESAPPDLSDDSDARLDTRHSEP